MRIEQLSHLRAVVEKRSFSAAAEVLFITQGALSKSIKALEDELRVQLLTRKRDNIALTPIGSLLYEYIINILDNYEMLVNTTEAISPPKVIRIASTYNMYHFGITNAIVDFEKLNTDFVVETHECTHSQMISSLVCGSVDFCIGFSELWEQSNKVSYVPLKKDRLGIVVGNGHPFSARRQLSYEKTQNIKFCFLREDPELFQYILNDFHRHKIFPNLTMSDVRLETIKHYTLSGMRATVHARSLLESYFGRDSFSHIDLRDSSELTLTIAYNPLRLTAVGAQFVSAIAAHYGISADLL